MWEQIYSQERIIYVSGNKRFGGIIFTVKVNKNDSLYKALKIFEAKCRKAHLFKIVQQKSHFISKSEQRHRRKHRRSHHH